MKSDTIWKLAFCGNLSYFDTRIIGKQTGRGQLRRGADAEPQGKNEQQDTQVHTIQYSLHIR